MTAQEVTEHRLSEDQLIARWLAPLAGPAGLGLRDDAALLAPPAGCELVMTVDALVSGIHFFAGDPPASIARKLLVSTCQILRPKEPIRSAFCWR